MHSEIVDANYDEELNKQIASVTLDEINENILASTITFESPSDISVDISEPDVLFFYIERADLILDSGTKEPLVN